MHGYMSFHRRGCSILRLEDISSNLKRTSLSRQATKEIPRFTAVDAGEGRKKELGFQNSSSLRVCSRGTRRTADAFKLLKRIAGKIPASRCGTRETRGFKKLMMAKLSITLMRGNLRLLSHVKDNFEPQGQV